MLAYNARSLRATDPFILSVTCPPIITKKSSDAQYLASVTLYLTRMEQSLQDVTISTKASVPLSWVGREITLLSSEMPNHLSWVRVRSQSAKCGYCFGGIVGVRN